MPTATPFGTTPAGTDVLLYTLQNAQGAQATISAYGGILTSLLMPDKNGQLGNVVLGFDSLSGYTNEVYQEEMPFFGALIGRYGNRIKLGKFTLDGQAYSLPINNAPNSLHGGPAGFHTRVWAAQEAGAEAGNSLNLRYVSPAGEEGYPGTLTVTVTYTLTDENVLRLDYLATTDQPTVLNLTNHSYFNLGYGQVADVLGHELHLAADRYTPVDDTQIPTGELAPVAGTPMDFTTPHAIGARIGQVPGGYDHNWVLADQHRPRPALAATVYEPTSGRTMAVYTTQPGVQFYAGNFLSGKLKGHANVAYGKYAGLALETQHFPDSPNQPSFPSTVLRPGTTFRSTTEYHFGVRK
ncbi:MAG: aldose epimerase family protein [Janthinobacterium lividum]